MLHYDLFTWKGNCYCSFRDFFIAFTILLVTHMMMDQNGVHLWTPLMDSTHGVLFRLCLTEVHLLFFHTKHGAFFHNFIKSLSLYIHRWPQRPQIARARRARAILILLVFEKVYSCLFISNYTWNHVITYTS